MRTKFVNEARVGDHLRPKSKEEIIKSLPKELRDAYDDLTEMGFMVTVDRTKVHDFSGHEWMDEGIIDFRMKELEGMIEICHLADKNIWVIEGVEEGMCHEDSKTWEEAKEVFMDLLKKIMNRQK